VLKITTFTPYSHICIHNPPERYAANECDRDSYLACFVREKKCSQATCDIKGDVTERDVISQVQVHLAIWYAVMDLLELRCDLCPGSWMLLSLWIVLPLCIVLSLRVWACAWLVCESPASSNP